MTGFGLMVAAGGGVVDSSAGIITGPLATVVAKTTGAAGEAGAGVATTGAVVGTATGAFTYPATLATTGATAIDFSDITTCVLFL